jgi:ADP-ribose pyrophosphatase YjhB (NUDIX family)
MAQRVAGALVVFARREGQTVVALVRQRTTYAFRDFMFVRYGSAREAADLVRRMTAGEVSVLLVQDYFAALAYLCAESRSRAWGRRAALKIQHAEKQFAAVMGSPEVAAAVRAPGGRAPPLTVPRGRLRREETALAAAEREWAEETGCRCEVRAVPCFRDDAETAGGVTYVTKYFCAVADRAAPIGVRSLAQLCEIGEALWVPVGALEGADPRQAKIVRAFHSWVKKRGLLQRPGAVDSVHPGGDAAPGGGLAPALRRECRLERRRGAPPRQEGEDYDRD